MMGALLTPGKRSGLNVLCLGAHSDDIEIGCGGTVLKLIEARQDISFDWIVFSAIRARRREAKDGATAFLRGARKKRVAVESFRDGYFPHEGGRIKEYFEGLKRRVSPDLIFTHFGGDFHQDHRLLSELTHNTFRDHLILEYEIPKYDGDLGRPSVYVHLTGEIGERKISYMNRCFATQRQNHWFSEDLFLAILRIRGIECNAPDRLAEAFHCRKLIVA